MKKQKATEDVLLSNELLRNKYNFKFVSRVDTPFEELEMPYWVNDGVILFYNTGEFNENDFLIGYAEMRRGKYYFVTFRWIRTEYELKTIFKAVRGKDLIEAFPKAD